MTDKQQSPSADQGRQQEEWPPRFKMAEFTAETGGEFLRKIAELTARNSNDWDNYQQLAIEVLRGALAAAQSSSVGAGTDVIARIVQEMREMALKPQLTEEDGFTSDQILKWADALASSGAPPQQTFPIPLNDEQLKAIKEWAADDRLWTTGDTVEVNLRTFARVILKLASGAPQRTAEGWRPIATAPVDSDVLAFCPKRTQPCVVARQRHDGLWHDKAWRSYSPTHWQPLPPPPSSSPGITPPQEAR